MAQMAVGQVEKCTIHLNSILERELQQFTHMKRKHSGRRGRKEKNNNNYN
jgi:hypothetical protein